MAREIVLLHRSIHEAARHHGYGHCGHGQSTFRGGCYNVLGQITFSRTNNWQI